MNWELNQAAVSLCMVASLATMVHASASATPQAETEARQFRQEYRDVYDGLRGTQCGIFIDRGVALIESASFAGALSKNARYGVAHALYRCARHFRRWEPVFRAADLIAALAPREDVPQYFRMAYGVEFGRPESSLDAFEALVSMKPDWLRRMPVSRIRALMRAADQVEPHGDRKLALLDTLMRLRYGPDGAANDDALRFAHARLLLARGRIDEARARLEGVTDISAIAQMRIEKLFDPLRKDPEFEARLEFGAALERDLARSSAMMDAHPDWIVAAVWHADLLTVALRFEEALSVVDAALNRLREDQREFVDGHVHRRLLLQTRAAAMLELGRTDNAVATMLEAANELQYGGQNVAQTVALSLLLVDLGRAAQALPLLDGISGATIPEQAWAATARSCAGAQLGLESERIAGLEYLRAQAGREPAALSRALLCSADKDAAAALILDRLANQGTSGDALLALQRRPGLPSDQLPYRRVLLERIESLRARADVRAAVDAIGAIEAVPFDIGGD